MTPDGGGGGPRATAAHDPDGVPYGDGFCRDIFATPLVTDGIRGDVGVGAGATDPAALVGKRVTAKRLGWDDGEDAEDDPDHTPYSEMGYASPDLAGVLTALHFDLPGGSPGVAWEVGGQPADPETIRPAEESDD